MVDVSFRAWPRSTIWHLDVKIYPTASDVGRTKGLCGVLGSGLANDLTRRDNSTDNPDNYNDGTPPNDFANSWL
jgi:hypothetical protein